MSVVKEGWTYKKLGEVCEVVSGSTPKTNVPEYWGNGHYWVTPAEITDSTVYIDKTERQITDEALAKTNLQLMPVGTVLLSSRAPIGKVAITNVEMYCNQGFKNCICSDNLYNKYLFYFFKLKKDYLNSLGRGATFKEISKSIVEGISIPIPPLPTQQSIVSELDKINELIALKKSQLKDLDTLAQSIFYEMFGDPITNEKGWEVKKYSDCFTIGSGGTPSKSVPDYWDNGTIPWIGSNMCQNSVITETDGKFITEEGLRHSSAKMLEEGTVLVALVGATIGKVALLRTKTSTNQNIAFIKVNETKEFVSEYVFFHLMNQYNEFMLIGNGDFKMASQAFIKALNIMVPPFSLQHQFAERVEAIERLKQEVQTAIKDLETLLASRMQYWFE